MFIGIDVGGTHTDAVLALPDKVCKTAKVQTQIYSGDLTRAIDTVLSQLIKDEDPSKVTRVCVSSTLGLNTLLTKRYDPTGVIAIPGPGIKSLECWQEDPLFYTLEGAQDHRGVITKPVNKDEVMDVLRSLQKKGATALAIVAKFSPKNPKVEEYIAHLAQDMFPANTPIVIGSSVSGNLNFPRRVQTAWCKAALTRANSVFISTLKDVMKHHRLTCPLVIVKSDAGVFSDHEAASNPMASIGSGPAAGMLGLMASSSPQETTLMLDIGGTTTDISLLAYGEPLLDHSGMVIGKRATLIRCLRSTSIALGGDSALQCKKGSLTIGPERLGPALCLAQGEEKESTENVPTLIDALNVIGVGRVGKISASEQGLSLLAQHPNSPEADPTKLAHLFVNKALTIIKEACQKFIAEVNEKPAYTIREMLIDETITPEKIAIVGTPAELFIPILQNIFLLPLYTPKYFAYANALGAALALPTNIVELYADTELGFMHIPTLEKSKAITSDYTLDEAKKDCEEALWSTHDQHLTSIGHSHKGTHKEHVPPEQSLFTWQRSDSVQIIHESFFSIITDSGRPEKIIHVGVQFPAGIIKAIHSKGNTYDN